MRLDDLNLTILDEPAGNNVLVVPFIQAIQSTILLTDKNREKPECGIVIKCGAGGIGSETGREVPVLSQIGQLAWFGRYAGLAFDVQGQAGPVPALIMRDTEILLRRGADLYELEIHDHDPRKMHLKGLTCEHCPGADLVRLQALARGEDPDVVDAEVTEPERTPVEKSTLLEEERARVRREREARDAPQAQTTETQDASVVADQQT